MVIPELQEKGKAKKPIILVGNPNVGKSVIFGILTKTYAIVSNYPGTTVEISRGEVKYHKNTFSIIDTPGIANLLPMSADEVVTRDIFLEEKDSTVLQIADSKNLTRAFLITLQLAEMEIPFVLAMNMADEARERRIFTDHKKLSEILGVDVFPTIAVSRTGTDKLLPALNDPKKSKFKFKYDPFVEEAIEKIEKFLPKFPVSKRSIALMILSRDSSMDRWLEGKISNEIFREMEKIIREIRSRYPDPLEIVINKERLKIAEKLKNEVAIIEKTPRKGFLYKAGKICMHPRWGIPILIAVLFLMWYFVGNLGAGVAVDFLENTVFGDPADNTGIINPFIARFFRKLNSPFIYDLFMGEYGLISIGLKYAIAIVLPIVAAFFLFFSFLEDSGYLPRLAIMANKICSIVGLNGKAVLPMVLGLGCGGMATISARILDTSRERMLVILLISLGIPCSAQLGVIMGMLGGVSVYAFLIWLLIVLGSIILVGYVANKALPGESSDFIMEIPPLRAPNVWNIIIKTLARIEWFTREAVPIFLLATLVLFFLDRFHILQFIQNASSPLISGILGLPREAVNSFLMGFLRRDYGAAGLMDLANRGFLNNNQILVSMVTITLFIPCVAQFFIIIKEKGFKAAFTVGAFVFIFAFVVGGLLNFILNQLGVVL